MAMWENYSEVLNTCIERLNMGEALEQILADYPAMSEDLRPMLEVGRLFQRVHIPSIEVQAVQSRIAPKVQAATSSNWGFAGNYWLLWIVPIFVLALLIILSVSMQNEPELFPDDLVTDTIHEIQLIGIISEISSDSLIVNGLEILVADRAILENLAIGDEVTINGIWQGEQILAQGIEPVLSNQVVQSTPLITIEGEIEAIDGNIIRIYGMDFVLAPNDALLTVLQIGDMLRLDGEFQSGQFIIIHIIVLEETVFISETGEVWRDSGNCNNPPPPWAVATGWRNRCEGGGNNTGRGSRRSS